MFTTLILRMILRKKNTKYIDIYYQNTLYYYCGVSLGPYRFRPALSKPLSLYHSRCTVQFTRTDTYESGRVGLIVWGRRIGVKH
jgi:hypothetical protein